MPDSEALRLVGRLIADCNRPLLHYAVTEEYFDALARAAAAAVKRAGRADDRVTMGRQPGGVPLAPDPMQGWSGARRLSASSDKSP